MNDAKKLTKAQTIDLTRAWFYAGPYVPSGVIYGEHEWPSRSHWIIPGYDPESRAINIYETGRAALQAKAVKE